MTGAPCLLVFAKVPVPGRVKTRLTPPLTPEQGAALYRAFLLDALDAFADQAAGRADPLGLGGPVSVRLYLDEEPPPGLVPDGISVHRQAGDGLGARMAAAFLTAFRDGHDRIVVVGTDHPTLPLPFLGEAFRQLAEPMTLAVAPSDDGGYVFLGLNEFAPALFAMRFSHDAVFADTLGAAMASGLQAVLLPEHYDVDTIGDLARLAGEWSAGAAVGARTDSALRALTERPELAAYFSGPT